MKGILFHISLHSNPMTRKRQDVVSTIFLVDTQHPPSKKLETSEQVCDFRTACGS